MTLIALLSHFLYWLSDKLPLRTFGRVTTPLLTRPNLFPPVIEFPM